MPVDTSIYGINTTPDIVGSFMRGQNFRQMMEDRAYQQQQRQIEEQKREGIKGAFFESMSPTPGGFPQLNEEMAFSKLLQVDPMTAMKFRDSTNQQLAAQKTQARADESLLLEKKRLQSQEKFQKARLAHEERRVKLAEEKGRGLGKVRDLYVPGIGEALTATDAKTLKSAVEMKDKFDRQVKELVDLRKEYGVEYFNREAVGRGKQLSKDLLLTYKNLAKLGVLSKSDEDIINAIIPSDPLGQDWAPGQDPILHQLTKFKEDLDQDFQKSVGTRTVEGTAGMRTGKPKTVIQNGQIYNLNPSTGEYE